MPMHFPTENVRCGCKRPESDQKDEAFCYFPFSFKVINKIISGERFILDNVSLRKCSHQIVSASLAVAPLARTASQRGTYHVALHGATLV